MNKSELIEAIAVDAGISKAAAAKALQAMMDAVKGSLKKGDKVTLVGFGSWSVSKRASRVGRNPKTGKAIQITAKRIVKFKASEALLDTDDTGPMKSE
jgi:DNA-binding protein HU-beta